MPGMFWLRICAAMKSSIGSAYAAVVKATANKHSAVRINMGRKIPLSQRVDKRSQIAGASRSWRDANAGSIGGRTGRIRRWSRHAKRVVASSGLFDTVAPADNQSQEYEACERCRRWVRRWRASDVADPHDRDEHGSNPKQNATAEHSRLDAADKQNDSRQPEWAFSRYRGRD
jgi:hypothetical protein